MRKVSRKVAKEFAALARMPDEKIDLTDALEVRNGEERSWGSFIACLVVVCSPDDKRRTGRAGRGRIKLCSSATVFLVGNIEPTMEWYKHLGFDSEYYPPGFAILRRDDIEVFLQQQPAYVTPEDEGRRKRHAWDIYIVTDNVKALYEEYSALPGVKISRPLCPQD